MTIQTTQIASHRYDTGPSSPRHKSGGIDPHEDFPDSYDDMHLRSAVDEEGCFVFTTWRQVFLTSAGPWPLDRLIDQWSHVCAIDHQDGMAASRFVKSDIDPRCEDAEFQRVYSWKLTAKNGCKSTRRVVQEFGPRSKTLRACSMIFSGRNNLRSDNQDIASTLGVPILEDVRDYRLMCDALHRTGSVINTIATGTSRRRSRNPNNVPRIAAVNSLENGWFRVATPELNVRGALRLPAVNIRLLARFWNGEHVQQTCSKPEYTRIKSIDSIIRGLDRPTQRQCRELAGQH